MGSTLFNRGGALSLGSALDIILRWFMQHPPAFDWMVAYHARWLCEHPRGKPKIGEDPLENQWGKIMQMGFASVEDYKEFLEKRKVRQLRETRERMETRDLTAEEIAPLIELSWVQDGTLKIPKNVKAVLDIVPNRNEPT
jgi:hypothetical protein